MPKLSIRAAYWIASLVIPFAGTAIWILVLLTTSYGDNLPLFFKFIGPSFVGVVTAWFLLVQLKPAADSPQH